MGWNLFLDDIRHPRCVAGTSFIDWEIVSTYAQAQEMIRRLGPPTIATLDHDLGMLSCETCARSGECFIDEDEAVCGCDCHVVSPSGYDLLHWMIETNNWPLNTPRVHSANVIGAANMRALIENYERSRT